MGNKLTGLLEMFARELLRNKMSQMHRTGEEEHQARKAARDLTSLTGQEYEVQYFRSHAEAEMILKGLKEMDPKGTMFGNSRLDSQNGHCVIVPKSADRIVRMITKDYGKVSIIKDMNGKELVRDPFKTTIDKDGWAHISFGELADPQCVLGAQYLSSVLNDGDIATRTVGNQILCRAEDYGRALDCIIEANEKLAKMGPDRAEEFLKEQYFDRTGHRFDENAKVVLPDSATPTDTQIVDTMLSNGDITDKEYNAILNEEISGGKDVKAFFNEHRDATVRALAENAEYVNPSQLHIDRELIDEARDLADRNEREAASKRAEKPAKGEEERDEADPSKGKVSEAEKTGPEQTPEIEAEEAAEKTVETPAATVDGVPVPGEDADAALSRETRKAELHEDIANVKTTADCVQARPDANSQDISTPYADGQDAPGTGDMDGDGVQDSAEDRDGDGTPDEWDGDSEYIDDDPDYEPVSMKQRDIDDLKAEKVDAANFEDKRAASRDVALETVER